MALVNMLSKLGCLQYSLEPSPKCWNLSGGCRIPGFLGIGIINKIVMF